jgi:hypothetical protein
MRGLDMSQQQFYETVQLQELWQSQQEQFSAIFGNEVCVYCDKERTRLTCCGEAHFKKEIDNASA